MKLIPAIDISQGKCVRLTKGKMSEKRVYHGDPAEVVRKLKDAGINLIHVVDLDSAMNRGQNREVIKRMLTEIKIPIQLGGGIRSIESIEEWLNHGVTRVVLGTVAIENPEIVKKAVKDFGTEKIVIAIDVHHGYVRIHGWRKKTREKAISFAKKMEELGVSRFLYTDITRDGTLSGIPLESLKELGKSISGKIIASGGVGTTKDLIKLKELKHFNVDSVIVGKALYEGKINLSEAIKLLEK